MKKITVEVDYESLDKIMVEELTEMYHACIEFEDGDAKHLKGAIFYMLSREEQRKWMRDNG